MFLHLRTLKEDEKEIKILCTLQDAYKYAITDNFYIILSQQSMPHGTNPFTSLCLA